MAVVLVAVAAAFFGFRGWRTEAVPSAAATIRTVKAVEVKLANRTLSASGFPERFCQHQAASSRSTAPYVLALAEGASKIEALAAVRRCGARVIGPLPPNAFLVETSVFALGKLSVDGHFVAASEWLPEDKVDARLKPLLEAGGEAIDVTVVALSSEDVDPLVAHAMTQGGEKVKGCLNGKSSVTLHLPRAVVTELAKRGDVRWLEPFSRPKLLNDMAVEPAAMNVRTVWDAHGLTGEGQLITTSDSGIDTGNLVTMHADLKNRVAGFQVVSGCYSYDANGHGTHTAGSIVGDGTLSGGQIRGTAHGARLWAWFCSGTNGYLYMPSDYDELFRPSGRAEGACIHSASWGDEKGSGSYTAECAGMDEYVWEHPDFLPVVANGNEGPSAQTVSAPATAKNVLSVGATQGKRSGDVTKMTSFSSRGPCADGRTKPDLCTPGANILSARSTYGAYGPSGENENYAYCSGTSMATPLTAGAAALVREWLVERRGFTNAVPTAALLKAVLTGGAKGGSVPDNDFGWGRTDLGESLYPSNRAVRLVDRVAFGENSVHTLDVTLTNAAPFDVQLVWIDYPATAGATKTLVNDLDLVVSNRTTGAVWYGNGVAGGDHTNNVESVRIAEASPGEYAVFVRGCDVTYDSTEGGAAALYLRGAFEGEAEHKPMPRELSVDAENGDDATATGEPDRPYATISAALVVANSGDTLRVSPGVYAGGLSSPSATVRIEATDGPLSTIIDGGGTNRCYDGSANASTVLSGFTLTNGWVDAMHSEPYGAGAYGGTLSNCVVRNCYASGGGGGVCNVKLYGCVIADCEADLQGGGAYGSTLVDCTVRGCRAGTLGSPASEYAGGGVDFQCICTNTVLWENFGPTGDTDNWEVYNYGNYDFRGVWRTYGIYVPCFYWCCTTPYNSISAYSITDDPRFVSTNDFSDVRLYDISPCIGNGTGGANIGAYAGSGIVFPLPAIGPDASAESVSNAVAAVPYADPGVAQGIGTNAATYLEFSTWATNGLASKDVILSTRAFDSFRVRELVAAPTLLGDGNETKVELSALEPAADGTCSTVLRLVDGDTAVPLCSVKAAFAARTRVGADPDALEAANPDHVATESVDDGRAVKLTITPPRATWQYFMRFDIDK